MRQDAIPARRPRTGFSLVEALVATAAMGLILGALASVTGQWLPSWSRGLGRVQRSEGIAIALNRVAADLAAAEYVSRETTVRNPLFEGNANAVLLVRTVLGPNDRPGLEIVRISEIVDRDGPVLVRTRARFTPLPAGRSLPAPLSFSDPVVLLRAPLRLTFAYAGPDGLWKAAWTDETQLPRTVRVTVRDGLGSGAVVVSTATPIHVTMAAPDHEQSEEGGPVLAPPSPGDPAEGG
jgi:general secretion pathway protein J